AQQPPQDKVPQDKLEKYNRDVEEGIAEALQRLQERDPKQAGKDKKVSVHSLKLNDDRKGARIELPLRESGSFKLVLEAEHGILTELEPRSVTVDIDQPPAILKISGSDDLRTFHPYDRVEVE